MKGPVAAVGTGERANCTAFHGAECGFFSGSRVQPFAGESAGGAFEFKLYFTAALLVLCQVKNE